MLSIKNQHHSTKPQAYLYSLFYSRLSHSMITALSDYPICDMHS